MKTRQGPKLSQNSLNQVLSHLQIAAPMEEPIQSDSVQNPTLPHETQATTESSFPENAPTQTPISNKIPEHNNSPVSPLSVCSSNPEHPHVKFVPRSPPSRSQSCPPSKLAQFTAHGQVKILKRLAPSINPPTPRVQRKLCVPLARRLHIPHPVPAALIKFVPHWNRTRQQQGNERKELVSRKRKMTENPILIRKPIPLNSISFPYGPPIRPLFPLSSFAYVPCTPSHHSRPPNYPPFRRRAGVSRPEN